MIHAHLFDDVESSPTSREIDRIGDVEFPRPISDERAHKAEREESEVAVRHVAILGVEQEPRHYGHLRVTEHDHCATSQRHTDFVHYNCRYTGNGRLESVARSLVSVWFCNLQDVTQNGKLQEVKTWYMLPEKVSK